MLAMKRKMTFAWACGMMFHQFHGFHVRKEPVSIAGSLEEIADEFFHFLYAVYLRLGILISVCWFFSFSYHVDPRTCFLSLKVRNLLDVGCWCCEKMRMAVLHGFGSNVVLVPPYFMI